VTRTDSTRPYLLVARIICARFPQGETGPGAGGTAAVREVGEHSAMTSGTEAAVLALVGALVGSLASSVVAVATLRMTQRAENERRAGDRVWQVESELRSDRRNAYTRFL
jgi:hypothetical protein